MSENCTITNEQINDLPLLLGIIEEMGVRRVIDAHIRPHGNWEGSSVGTAVSVWLCHLLMERDHRVVSVREWGADRQQTLQDLSGQVLRETDLSDDRLANVLTMLSDPADQRRWIRRWRRIGSRCMRCPARWCGWIGRV